MNAPDITRSTGRYSLQSARGFTLMEMVLLIVVLSVGLAGIALSLQQAVRGSSDPLVQKQVVAIAESLMQEILLLPYTTPTGTCLGVGPTECVGTTRDTFNSVSDWNGFSMTGFQNLDGSVSLSGYNVTSVSVTATTLNSQTAKLVTVTVTGPGGTQFVLDGYKLNYIPGTSP